MEQYKFSEIDLSDPFFNSLKEDYPEFSDWYTKKSVNGAKAYVQKNGKGLLLSFLYMKKETEEVTDVNPPMPAAIRLKVGTFKIEAHSTRLGETFVKKIMHAALHLKAKEIYVTIFEKHVGLIKLLKRYGFVEYGTKGEGESPELVLVKSMVPKDITLLEDYPFIHTEDKRKFVLSVWPEYHTSLFPDSILNNEERAKDFLVKDITHTNSIHKIYICRMDGVDQLKRGDILLIYRTSDGQGPARFRSVISSVCVVEEVKSAKDFKSIDEYLEYSNAYSIFDESELKKLYYQKGMAVIKMTYNAAFDRRVTRGELIDEVGISKDQYWGFFQLSDEQFEDIISRGKVNESIIVN